jgi:hypothetical protein
MSNNDSPRKPLPPYISLKTLLSFMDKMKETTVPERIDGSVLKNYAGSTAAQLTTTLRFLGFIEDNGTSTELLGQMVNAYKTDFWASEFGEVMRKAYAPIVKDLKLETATPSMLNERFRVYGAEGEVLEKCVRFFEAGMIEGGVKLSPHILNKPRAKPDRKPKPKRTKPNANDDDDNLGDLRPSTVGTKRFSFPIPDKPDAMLMLPTDLTTEDWEMIDVMIRAYVSRREKAEK